MKVLNIEITPKQQELKKKEIRRIIMRKMTTKKVQKLLEKNPGNAKLQELLTRKLTNQAKHQSTIQITRSALALDPDNKVLQKDLHRKLNNRAKSQRAESSVGPLQTVKHGLYHKAPKKRRALFLELGVPKNVPYKGRQNRIHKMRELLIERGIIKRPEEK